MAKPKLYYLHDAEGPDSPDDFSVRGSLDAIMEHIKKQLVTNGEWNGYSLSDAQEWSKQMRQLRKYQHTPIKDPNDKRMEGLFNVYLNWGRQDEHWIVRAKSKDEALKKVLAAETQFNLEIQSFKEMSVDNNGGSNLEYVNSIFEGDPDTRRILDNPTFTDPYCWDSGS